MKIAAVTTIVLAGLAGPSIADPLPPVVEVQGGFNVPAQEVVCDWLLRTYGQSADVYQRLCVDDTFPRCDHIELLQWVDEQNPPDAVGDAVTVLQSLEFFQDCLLRCLPLDPKVRFAVSSSGADVATNCAEVSASGKGDLLVHAGCVVVAARGPAVNVVADPAGCVFVPPES